MPAKAGRYTSGHAPRAVKALPMGSEVGWYHDRSRPYRNQRKA